MSSIDRAFTQGGSGKPTGIPDDALEAAAAINAELGRRVNLPGPDRTGILLHGIDADKVDRLAQVSQALSLADIARSLRALVQCAQGGNLDKDLLL